MPKKKQRGLVFPYDKNNFNPPAPVLEVVLTTPISGLQGRVIKSSALLDSGADITVIPHWAAQQLQLKYVDEIQASGYDGVPQKTYVYSVKIIFDKIGDFTIRTITTDNDYALIGRDILNKWSLFLEGSDEVFEIK